MPRESMFGPIVVAVIVEARRQGVQMDSLAKTFLCSVGTLQYHITQHRSLKRVKQQAEQVAA